MKGDPRGRGPRPGRPILALGLALACALAGCGKEDDDAKFYRRPVELAKVPEPVLQAARKQLPGVELAEAWSNHLRGKEEIESYEVRGKTKSSGKTREVRVGLDGKILEVE